MRFSPPTPTGIIGCGRRCWNALSPETGEPLMAPLTSRTGLDIPFQASPVAPGILQVCKQHWTPSGVPSCCSQLPLEPQVWRHLEQMLCLIPSGWLIPSEGEARIGHCNCLQKCPFPTDFLPFCPFTLQNGSVKNPQAWAQHSSFYY